MTLEKIRVTIWNEFVDEKINPKVKAVYPDGIHAVLAAGLAPNADFTIRTATMQESENGLSDEVLNSTDVMLWFSHSAYKDVTDEITEKVYRRILGGMGFIVLHSGYFSKVFQKLAGTSLEINWREVGEKERIWVVDPSHPITEGLGPYIDVPNSEMYGEYFDIPTPEQLVFISWFEGGEVCRSGCCYKRGKGRIFMFTTGHETFPIYYQPEILKVLANAVRWARPVNSTIHFQGAVYPLEPLANDEHNTKRDYLLPRPELAGSNRPLGRKTGAEGE